MVFATLRVMKRFFSFAVLVLLAVSSVQAQRSATILDHKDRIRITEVPVLNSQYRETNLSVTPDGQQLYFMSLRGGQKWSQSYMTYRGDSVFDGDIWVSNKVNGRWQRPKPLPFSINTSQGEDEPNVTADGRTVYYQSWNYMWDKTGGPYYKAIRTNSGWSRPVGLGGGITEFFRIMPATDGMTISADEKKFIVAAGHEYDARMDIYMSKRTAYGWTYCKKLPISTAGDDRSVFLAADGKTLYFASDGYDGYGGLDIYKTTLNSDGTFGEVINVGKPFNTSQDDYGLILTGDGNEAYFIRDGNIQFADLREADERIKPVIPEVNHLIRGTVRDSLSWAGLTAEVQLYDAQTKRFIKRVTTTPSGKYSIEVPNKSRLYDQVVICNGYKSTRKRLKVDRKGYSDTYAANFLLGKPRVIEESRPPAIVENKPREKPVSNPPAETQKPAKDPEIPEIAQIKPPQKEEVKVASPKIKEPPAQKVEIEEDPTSFDGVAENNLILLLDVSASMKRPEKLPLLKDSFKRLLSYMRPEDRISIIVYSGDVRVVVEATSAIQRDFIMNTIENLRSGGGTKGKTALRKAYRLASDYFIPEGNNRIILATDGFFDVTTLYNIAEKNTNRDVYLSVFSFGKIKQSKIDELKLLAEKGGGNFASITKGNVDKAFLTEAKAVRK